MSLNNAINFIKRGMAEPSLRKRLNTSSTPSDLTAVLKEETLVFSETEFDEAFHSRLVKCQEKETADQLHEFRLWWEIISGEAVKGTCSKGSGCSSCH